MLLAFHGMHRSEAVLSRALRTDNLRGTNRACMVAVARAEGFRVRARGMTLIDLRRHVSVGEPVIVNYIEPSDEVGHFAVVASCDATNITLADPWNGEHLVLPVREFSRRWLGYKTRDTRKGWGMVAWPRSALSLRGARAA